MGAKGAVAPKAPDQVFGECCAALEVRSFSRLPTVQSAELYLTHSPRPARTAMHAASRRPMGRVMSGVSVLARAPCSHGHGRRSLRRFIIQPAEVFLSAGDGRWRFSRSARAGCVRAGRGECEVRYGSID